MKKGRRVYVIRGDGYWPKGSADHARLQSVGAALADPRYQLLENPYFIGPHRECDRGAFWATEGIVDGFLTASGEQGKCQSHYLPVDLFSPQALQGENALKVHTHQVGARWGTEWEPYVKHENFREGAILSAAMVWDHVLGVLRSYGEEKCGIVVVTTGLIMPPLIARISHSGAVCDDWYEPLTMTGMDIEVFNSGWNVDVWVDYDKII